MGKESNVIVLVFGMTLKNCFAALLSIFGRLGKLDKLGKLGAGRAELEVQMWLT